MNNTNRQGDEVEARARMLAQLRAYGIRDPRVLEAMNTVRRHRFIPLPYRDKWDCYGDHPCDIGFAQTISQPFIVAHMAELLQIRTGDRILEIGAGCGYQSAVLAALEARVYGIEIIPELATHARTVLREENWDNVEIKQCDGYHGWAEQQPFNGILLSCAATELPPPLLDQLGDGGRLIAPVGTGNQQLKIAVKYDGRIETTPDIQVRFVPLVRA